MNFYPLLFLICTLTFGVLSTEAKNTLPIDSIPKIDSTKTKTVHIPYETFRPDYDEVFKVVEKMPSFPGGRDAMNIFIQENLQYPTEAVKNSVEGTVKIQFIVTSTGEFTEASLIRGLTTADSDYGINDEALRLVNSMPDWIPGTQRGIPVAVEVTLPIQFKLDSILSDTTVNELPEVIEDMTLLDEMPKYPGGEMKLFRHIGKNIKYPKQARKRGVQGTTYIQFTIMKDGSFEDMFVKKGIEKGEACDEEAIRVLRLMKKWIPGKINGEPVNVLFVLPVRFKFY